MSPTAWLIWALVISTSFVSGHELVVRPAKSRPSRHVFAQRGHDRLAVDPERLFFVVVLQIAGKLVDSRSFSCMSLAM